MIIPSLKVKREEIDNLKAAASVSISHVSTVNSKVVFFEVSTSLMSKAVNNMSRIRCQVHDKETKLNVFLNKGLV